MTLNTQLSAEALKLTIDLDSLDLKAQLVSQRNILGQPRAQSALEFGIAMTNPGYNIFVMGEPGSGRLSMITGHLKESSGYQPTPTSFAYVDNIANPREPLVVPLLAGNGSTFQNDIEKLIDNLLVIIPSVFESPSYQQKKSAVERTFTKAYNQAIDKVEKRANSLDVALFRDSEAVTFAPIKNKKTLDDNQFAKLTQAERDAFHHHVTELEDYLGETLLELPQWRRVLAEHLKHLDNESVNLAVTPLFIELEEKYQNNASVINYLEAIKKNLDVVITEYLAPASLSDQGSHATKRSLLIELYSPNILIDHPHDSGAPVIYEPHPTYQNLFGRIEYTSEQGTLITNFRRICPGALHKANGGYLILDAEKLLIYPYVWDALKRGLQSGFIEIEAPYAEFGVNTVTLKPEPIPLSIKVILLGSQDTYYLLEELDNEFNEILKVLADVDNTIPLTVDTIQQFTQVMIHHARQASDKPLTPAAIQRLIEYSCRLSEHQQQFSAHIKDSLDIISEAQLFSRQSHHENIDSIHIETALAAREYRNGRIPQAILKEMLDGTVLIDTEGEAIGKINGLTVLEIGGSSFGAPARITTTVYPGSRGIVDIEREVELGQSIHSKGVMILTGYLGHCYAQQFPLAISASIAIEQSYGYIDGDSASLAELCCLISALTRIPIWQYFAVTGSINQYGEVQAIGGVNEKIEGFFRLCKARGLNGKHGVIIPAANKRNLMLKQEVIDAVQEGLFTIHAVATVNQTLELLTGQSAGTVDKEGNYPEHSLNHRAILRLKEISDITSEDDKEETL